MQADYQFGKVGRSSTMLIDLVYTWVNPHDDKRNAERAAYASATTLKEREYRAGAVRYQSRDELRFSVQNTCRRLPFLNRIYIVVGGPPLEWMLIDPRITVVPQESILPPEISPVFQSDIIEAFIHQIPGLSEHYVYANDDFFFAKRHSPTDLYDAEGRCLVGVDNRFLGLWGRDKGTYGAMELNAVRALTKRLKLPRYVGYSGGGRNGVFDHKSSRIKATFRSIPLLNTPTHVAQPYLRSVWKGFHEVFTSEIRALGSERFRSERGFTINYMYHHYCRSVGKAMFRYAPQHLYLDATTPAGDRHRLLNQLLGGRDAGITRFCLNDVPTGSATQWHSFVDQVLEACLLN